MARLELEVPFHDETEVSRRGAMWDPAAHAWYVPDGSDVDSFRAWIPIPVEVNVRAPWYFLGSSSHPCGHCGHDTRVYGFVLPAGHTVLNGGDVDEEDEWEVGDEPSLLSHIDHIIPSVVRTISSLAPNYRLGSARSDDPETWLNFCEYCGVPLNDEEVFSEPGMGFLAFTEEDARKVALLAIQEEFGAVCGCFSIGVCLFEEMAFFF